MTEQKYFLDREPDCIKRCEDILLYIQKINNTIATYQIISDHNEHDELIEKCNEDKKVAENMLDNIKCCIKCIIPTRSDELKKILNEDLKDEVKKFIELTNRIIKDSVMIIKSFDKYAEA